MEVVVANPVSAHGPGFVGWRSVDGAGVVGLKDRGVNLVILDDLVVASEPDRDMRDMINKIMRDTVADAEGGDPLLINWVPAGVVVNVVIVLVMSGRGEGLAVTAFEMPPWPVW